MMIDQLKMPLKAINNAPRLVNYSRRKHLLYWHYSWWSSYDNRSMF